ncbi:MAG TPA: histidinol-phosphatase [Chthoniobacterales bacterium]
MPPLLYESHMHTPLCNHSSGMPGDYAAVAEKRNLKGIIVTCHAPMPNGYSANVRMRPEEFGEYVALVDETSKEWAGRVDVRLGLESEYVPGYESWIEKLHQRAGFHHVLGSVHCQVSEYVAAYFKGDWLDFQRTYFRHLAEAAETGFYDTLSHPDLVKNEAPDEWQLDRIMDDIRRSLDRIASAGTAMELNTSGLNKTIPEMNPGQPILREMCVRNIPVVIGADAHRPGRVADRYGDALRMLQEAGYGEVSFFLERKRQTVLIPVALASLETA